MRKTRWTIAFAVLGTVVCVLRRYGAEPGHQRGFRLRDRRLDADPRDNLSWNGLDEAGCAGSGSADDTAANTGATFDAAISQCVAISGGGTLSARVRYEQPGTLTVRFDFASAANCSTGQLSTVTNTAGASPSSWSDAVLNNAAVPGGAHAVLVTVSASHTAPYHLLVDQVRVSRRPPLFFDNFQGDLAGEAHPCRWSSTTF